MTQEIINRWAQSRNMSERDAMVEIRELLTKEKDSIAVESSKTDMIPHFSINDIGW